MIRRSRISVRPNVKPAGRALTGSSDASLNKTQPPQTADSTPSEGSGVTVDQVKTDAHPSATEPTNAKAAISSSHEVESTSHGEDAATKTSDAQAATSTSLSSGPQRRKRLTALPNLAKPRASAASTKTPKSPSKSTLKPVTPSESEKSSVEELASVTPLVKEPVPNFKAPGRPRPSGGSRQPKAQPTPAAPPQTEIVEETKGGGPSEKTIGHVSQHPLETSQPDSGLLHENPPECPSPSALTDTAVRPENRSGLDPKQSQSDPLIEKLERLKSSSKVIKSLTALNDPADLIRLARARKLRELLKMEMSKSKEDKKKPKIGVKGRKAPKDHTKMTMKELIYYLPVSNPMKSFTEEEEIVSEIVLPNSPTPTSSKPSTGPTVQEIVARDAGHEEEEERVEESLPEEEEPLMVPRVKVAEDGSLIIDEESLTVQVSRTNGPNPAEDRDPIFERGSTTTYSSFRKGTYTKPWSSGETDMFYLAISMVGTDFSMIGQLFPHRDRVEIKNKFKKEERANSWRIDKAFKEKRRLDLDFFKTLMEQILEAEKTKKTKNKELGKLAKVQRPRRKPKVAKRKEMGSSDGSDSDEEAGEKENEDLWNDGEDATAPKKRRGGAEQSHIRSDGKDADDSHDCENEVSDAPSLDDRLKESDLSENVSKSPAIKPAQLKGRPQRPTPTLSQRWGNRRPAGEETKKSPKVTPMPVQAREKKQSSILHELEDFEEEPDLTAVQEQIFNKPTRSGRIPKLSQHVIQAAEEEDEEELSDLPLTSQVSDQSSRRAKLKPGPSVTQGMTRRGKSKLVTLRASVAEDDDDEEETGDCVLIHEDPEEENQPFVPMSLRSPPPVNSEVVETMEELDISMNVTDILDTSQHALCPDLSCEQAEMPAGSVPCEHQLDLLVDVIEFLDPDHMEVCKQINNEAAQTLLTIGNSALTQTAEMSCTGENYIGEQSLNIIQEEVVHEEVITETIEVQADTSTVMSGTSVSCEPETKSDLDPSSKGSPDETSTTTAQPISIETTNDVSTQDEMQNLGRSASDLSSRRSRFSKPKPNVGQGLRTRRAQKQQDPQELHSVQSSSDLTLTKEDQNPTEPTPQDSITVTQPDTSSKQRQDSRDAISEKVIDEDSGSVPSLKRKRDDIITEECAKKDRREMEEAGPETLQTNSVSVPQEESDESSKPVRRYRGPKPKPNLARTSRPPHTQTQQNTTLTTPVPKESSPAAEFSTSTFTSTESPEEGAVVPTGSDVSQRPSQQETVSTNIKSVKEVTPQVAEDELKQRTAVRLEESTRSTSDESSTKLPVGVLQDTSADPTADEPVFILSLTEIPPTFDEGTAFGTESKLLSQSQSVNESREPSHHLITDALVLVEEERGEGDGDKTRKRDLNCKASASRSPKSANTESKTERDVEVLANPVAERTKEEHLEKKRELPERARRAKLQVKPNPVTKRNTKRAAHANGETPRVSLEDTTSVPISTLCSEKTISAQEQNVQATISTTVNSDSLTSAVISDGETITLSSDVRAPPSQSSSDTKSPPQLASQDITAEKCAHVDPSQCIMGQVDLADKVGSMEASGSDVNQITPVATSGPLTRPGRRPKGFLSFITPKNTQGPPGTHRGAKTGPQKPVVNTTRPERKRVAASPVTLAINPEAKRPSTASASTIEQNSEEEPTSVSNYFFSDIFTEVDELEDMD
nr:transcription factor TFIIIB component B'' homolog isoform X3 [Misgurnus anguillicaudatus]